MIARLWRRSLPRCLTFCQPICCALLVCAPSRSVTAQRHFAVGTDFAYGYVPCELISLLQTDREASGSSAAGADNELVYKSTRNKHLAGLSVILMFWRLAVALTDVRV